MRDSPRSMAPTGAGSGSREAGIDNFDDGVSASTACGCGDPAGKNPRLDPRRYQCVTLINARNVDLHRARNVNSSQFRLTVRMIGFQAPPAGSVRAGRMAFFNWPTQSYGHNSGFGEVGGPPLPFRQCGSRAFAGATPTTLTPSMSCAITTSSTSVGTRTSEPNGFSFPLSARDLRLPISMTGW